MALCWLLGFVALFTGFAWVGIGSVGDIVFTGLLMGVCGAQGAREHECQQSFHWDTFVEFAEVAGRILAPKPMQFK